MPAIPLSCLAVVFRGYLACTARPRAVLLAVLLTNLINIGLDLWLIFGGLGVPALGAVGAGISTTTCNLILLLLWAAGAHQAAKGLGVSLWVRATRSRMVQVFKIGWPAGLQTSLEVGVFTAVSALIARFGEISLAGHQIAITLASLSFMSALGISMATTARVGHHIGAGSSELARKAGLIGIGIGASFMGLGGICFILMPELLAGLFTHDPAVIASASVLIRIAGAFALSDGVQVVSAGALRGAADTRWSLYANLIAHWFVGLPVALWLGQRLGLGVAGYWWGLTAGLTGVALTLLARFLVISARPLARAS
jgi:MATE family multidrug resistance protein